MEHEKKDVVVEVGRDNQNKTNLHSDFVQQTADKYVGRTIDGKYEVLKLIGQGGFYTTYLVKSVHVNKAWAMKVCDKKNRHYSPAIREIILTEPYMMKKLDHQAIPKVVDIIEDEDSIFIVRDYIEGETLETNVKMYGAQPSDKVVEWGKQLCNALGYLHSQTPSHIYRDMKPSNVILQPDGTIKIIDFGIMCTYKQNQNGNTCCLGTIGYAAPEQFGGSQIDARTDIYGLGMTMFRLVTGINPTEPPYEINPICLINPNLPKGLEYIISKCIKPNPDERYQTCDEMMADLNNYLSLPKPKGIFGKLFGKNEPEKKAWAAPASSGFQPIIPIEILMTSQFPALYLKENNPAYYDVYIKKLLCLGFNKKDAEKMFEFECGIIRKHGKQYLHQPQFTKMWFFNLKQPFFLQYPKTKEDILKEKFLTVSELCKIIDEAEWHFWNSHERELPDGVWEEIYAWHLKGSGAEFAIRYFEMIEKETGISSTSIAQLSSEQGKHLSQYKWR